MPAVLASAMPAGFPELALQVGVGAGNRTRTVSLENRLGYAPAVVLIQGDRASRVILVWTAEARAGRTSLGRMGRSDESRASNLLSRLWAPPPPSRLWVRGLAAPAVDPRSELRQSIWRQRVQSCLTLALFEGREVDVRLACRRV